MQIQNKSIIISYKLNQREALKECLNDFKITHSSVIADNLCGFQKSIFTCENCKNVSYYFNSFEYLIFDLEIISKHLNLNDNNNIIITFSFDECFQYLFKEELFENNYCQYCKIKTKSRYKENIYLMPNYLIIILDKGNNNFQYKFDIPLVFDSSNYEEAIKNKKYELVGIVSKTEENNRSPHYISFCKHNIDNKWRCFNDSIVNECGNDFLQKGNPHILFYKYKNELGNNNIAGNMNIFNNSINNNFQNNNMALFNQNQNMMFNNQNFNNNNIFQGQFNNFQGNFDVNNQNIGQNMNLNDNLLNYMFIMLSMLNMNNNC